MDLTGDEFQIYARYNCFWVSPKEELDKLYHHYIVGFFSYSYMSVGVVFKEFREKEKFLEYVEFKNKFSQYSEIDDRHELPPQFFQSPLSKEDVEKWLWYIDESLDILNSIIVKDTPEERANFMKYPEVVKYHPEYEEFWYYRVKDEYSNMAFKYENYVFKYVGEDGIDDVGYIYIEEKDSIYSFAHAAIRSLERMKEFIERYSLEGYDFWAHIAEKELFNMVFLRDLDDFYK